MNRSNPPGSDPPPAPGLAGRIAHAFVDSKLTPLIVLASVLLGLAAVWLLPREEEPQIKVPMVDVLVSMPGFSAREVEERATRPMEKLLWEIPGVEYIYSTSQPGQCLAIVRFQVGEDAGRSLVKLTEKLRSNFDRIPHGVAFPLIKPKSIDDVPILALTFHSARYDHLTLRRLVAQVDDAVKQVPLVAETAIIGGDRRQLRVLLDPVRLASRSLTAARLVPMLRQANRQFAAGGLTSANREVIVETGAFLSNAGELATVVVGVFGGKPVYLRDVADIVDGAEEPSQYVFFGRGAAAEGRSPVSPTGSPPRTSPNPVEQPAVTLSIAKRPGANAVAVAGRVLEKVGTLRGVLIPADVELAVTRNYGETAADKSNELLLHMLIAVGGVSLLILLTLGWRESGIVAVAIPSTLALTLLVFFLHGYTLNRITLFALIFSIGILVDDAIVVVENIVRHLHLPRNRGRPRARIAVEAVNEVGNPTILATFAVIAAVLPMAFVGGLMGPYMRPIPIGSGAAMFFSLAIAFIVTPWTAVRLLRSPGEPNAESPPNAGTDATPVPVPRPAGSPTAAGGDLPHDRLDARTPEVGDSPNPPHLDRPDTTEDFFTRLYRRLMGPLLSHRRWRFIFLGTITGLLLTSMALVGAGWVKVKMLPFDNKSEFQIILNMPEGSSLERTAQAAREIAAAIRVEPEVTDYQIYAGVAAPFNFNGLVRHYFLRRGAHVADIQVNLVDKHRRRTQSHDIAKRVRPGVAAIAARYDARVAVAEVPPGPPVLQTLVAEVYGPTDESRLALANRIRDIFRQTEGVVDVDWYVEADQPKTRFVIDKEKAALHGISAETISQTLRIAVGGESIDLLHDPAEKEDVNIVLQLPFASRTQPEELLALRVRSGDANALPEPGATGGPAPLVPLRELVTLDRTTVDKSIYHKNLMPVTYVVGDVAGTVESPVYAILAMNKALRRMDRREFMPENAPPVSTTPLRQEPGTSAPDTAASRSSRSGDAASSPRSQPVGAVPGRGGPDSRIRIYNAVQPFTDQQPAVKWDGEWHITIEVFRDLGLAFAAVLVLIYFLMVGWFRSFLTPLVVMAAIPFSLVGILPAHGLLHAFFTATSMIGFMAGAGIVVRNSIILVDFIEQRRREGLPLDRAVVDAGAVRFRPMLLTALAVVVGAGVILFDPIFQGLAVSLMAGEIASLLISRIAVPVLYFMAFSRPAPPTPPG